MSWWYSSVSPARMAEIICASSRSTGLGSAMRTTSSSRALRLQHRHGTQKRRLEDSVADDLVHPHTEAYCLRVFPDMTRSRRAHSIAARHSLTISYWSREG